jgi:hypothetical protein
MPESNEPIVKWDDDNQPVSNFQHVQPLVEARTSLTYDGPGIRTTLPYDTGRTTFTYDTSRIGRLYFVDPPPSRFPPPYDTGRRA